MATDTTPDFCKLAIENVIGIVSIKFPQYPTIGSKFQAICIEEAYEEIDVLVDDVASGFDESVILETICEDIKIKNEDKEPICSAIHYSLTRFSPPPTSLNLADISMKVDQKELDLMKGLVSKQVHLLKPKGFKDETLLKLLIVGQKNHFPLLTYLVDTYGRFRLIEYQKLYEQFNKIIQHKKRTRFMAKKFKSDQLPDFFNKCDAMKKLKKKKEQKKDVNAEKALEWYLSAMQSFFRRLWGPLKMIPQQMLFKINDNIITYSKYYLSMLVTVNNILSNASTKLPLQIDFWVIPKAIKQYNINEDDDEEKDDDLDDDVYTTDEDAKDDGSSLNINNLEERLKSIKNVVTKNITNKEMPRTFFQVYEQVVKYERSKRMVIIVDRRIDGKDKIENQKNHGLKTEESKEGDKLYAFLPKNSGDIPSGRYLHESLFNLSRIEVIPTDNEYEPPSEQTSAIHASSDLPNMCLLSIQIHEESVVRAYWYINGSAARFYVNDMVNIWPLYFIEKSIDEKTGQIHHQDVQELRNLIKAKSKFLPLRDANFDTFFEQNTKIKASDGYNKQL